jgi:hypothetical protein
MTTQIHDMYRGSNGDRSVLAWGLAEKQGVVRHGRDSFPRQSLVPANCRIRSIRRIHSKQ